MTHAGRQHRAPSCATHFPKFLPLHKGNFHSAFSENRSPSCGPTVIVLFGVGGTKIQLGCCLFSGYFSQAPFLCSLRLAFAAGRSERKGNLKKNKKKVVHVKIKTKNALTHVFFFFLIPEPLLPEPRWSCGHEFQSSCIEFYLFFFSRL